MMRHSARWYGAALFGWGMLWLGGNVTPSCAAALAGGGTGTGHGAEMAARMQPVEQQAVVQARPGVGAAADTTGLLAWPGVPRLGLPVLRMPDFSTMAQPADGNPCPMLPWLALAATWDPELARRAGVARARGEWRHGRAVLRVGGVDLLPSGRLQAGEDQMLAGATAGMIGAGLLSGHVLPVFGSVVGEEQARADGALPERTRQVPATQLVAGSLLGVAVALETAHGGAILCGGMAACETVTGLEQMVHDGWRFPGMVMALPGGAGQAAGNGAAPAMAAVGAGVDMEQVGVGENGRDVLGASLRQAVREGSVKPARVQAMAAHILASFYMAGSIDHPPPFASTRATVEPSPTDTLVGDVEAEGAVLLQNENRVLPLDPALGPVLLLARPAMAPAAGRLADALRHAGLGVSLIPLADGAGAPGTLPPAAAQAARILVLSSSNDDNRLITSLADLGGHVAVVLGADDPDRQMPWLDMVDSVVQAWAWRDEYAQPLAALLVGQQEFSGHLPVTLTGGFYPPGLADADYRAFAGAHIVPLFPFGYGLSTHARITLNDLRLTREGGRLTASFSVTNPGGVPVRAVPQLYVDPPPDQPGLSRRLAAWRSITLAPGHTVRLVVPVSLRLLGQWDPAGGNWAVAAGDYTLSLGFSSVMLVRHAGIHLPALHVSGALEAAPIPVATAE
ncbi:glycoside hydrolase family 3 protein [Komagataeibacter sp. FNDCR2]|uniref:glycoside hydrolase family 3 protein n=1 Tax=Komagataeibacter sp. FNDCR2 TaxID=2878682 RepID=UPI001E3793E7|nr:glycoside hydrolase family 3 C-terminal domain-containing protein [Komagataeibacter sp. FNDCR2]MCE2576172.1 glycoside hydrolase family 3 C-terminal domain-containing protein [Komagataeibacter sp. FNDCR2]